MICIVRRTHNQSQGMPPIIFKTDKAQFTEEGVTLPILRLEKFTATTEKIKKRVNSPFLNQRNSRELREQHGNMLPNQIVPPVAKQPLAGLTAIADHAAFVHCQRWRLIPLSGMFISPLPHYSVGRLSLIHISEPTRQAEISYA